MSTQCLQVNLYVNALIPQSSIQTLKTFMETNYMYKCEIVEIKQASKSKASPGKTSILVVKNYIPDMMKGQITMELNKSLLTNETTTLNDIVRDSHSTLSNVMSILEGVVECSLNMKLPFQQLSIQRDDVKNSISNASMSIYMGENNYPVEMKWFNKETCQFEGRKASLKLNKGDLFIVAHDFDKESNYMVKATTGTCITKKVSKKNKTTQLSTEEKEAKATAKAEEKAKAKAEKEAKAKAKAEEKAKTKAEKEAKAKAKAEEKAKAKAEKEAKAKAKAEEKAKAKAEKEAKAKAEKEAKSKAEEKAKAENETSIIDNDSVDKMIDDLDDELIESLDDDDIDVLSQHNPSSPSSSPSPTSYLDNNKKPVEQETTPSEAESIESNTDEDEDADVLQTDDTASFKNELGADEYETSIEKKEKSVKKPTELSSSQSSVFSITDIINIRLAVAIIPKEIKLCDETGERTESRKVMLLLNSQIKNLSIGGEHRIGNRVYGFETEYSVYNVISM